MTTVIGYFRDVHDADRAVKELLEDGAPRDQLSIFSNKDAHGTLNKDGKRVEHHETGAAGGATSGAVIGGAVGVAIGLGLLTIPGIGPVLAAGPLAAALTSGAAGAVAGGVAGGLLGALVDLGVPKDRAERYVEGVKRGGTLVTLRAVSKEGADAAERIMKECGAEDVDEKSDGGERVSRYEDRPRTHY